MSYSSHLGIVAFPKEQPLLSTGQQQLLQIAPTVTQAVIAQGPGVPGVVSEDCRDFSMWFRM
jgi:hypothetical protein